VERWGKDEDDMGAKGDSYAPSIPDRRARTIFQQVKIKNQPDTRSPFLIEGYRNMAKLTTGNAVRESGVIPKERVATALPMLKRIMDNIANHFLLKML